MDLQDIQEQRQQLKGAMKRWYLAAVAPVILLIIFVLRLKSDSSSTYGDATDKYTTPIAVLIGLFIVAVIIAVVLRRQRKRLVLQPGDLWRGNIFFTESNTGATLVVTNDTIVSIPLTRHGAYGDAPAFELHSNDISSIKVGPANILHFGKKTQKAKRIELIVKSGMTYTFIIDDPTGFLQAIRTA